MNTVVTAETVCAVITAMCIAFHIAGHYKEKSARTLTVNSIVVLVWLITDIASYRTGLSYVPTLLTFSFGSIAMHTFTVYCEAYIGEKTEINRWVFRAPEIVSALCAIAIAVSFAAGKVVAYENGVPTAIYGTPAYIQIVLTVLALYTPAVALAKRKSIGLKSIVMLGLFSIAPIIAMFMYKVTEKDFSVVFSAITLMLVILFIQDEMRRSDMAERTAHEALAENSARFFALEDDFESLYDVELDSGRYVSFDRDEFYKRNISSRFVSPVEFFTDLRTNIENVVFEEDRDGVYGIVNREAICRELSERDHFDHFYRVITERGPIWFKMRIVYKDAEKKNVIIGVFNAEEEMAAKEQEAERLKSTELQLRHEHLRTEVLNYMVDHDDDPIELLKNFAERIRVLINCDQVIYRDLEETRIMVNSPEIEKTWSVPIEFCQQCEHFDAHHPMYAGGYTEMDNCQEGWQGIPVYHKCPIKSSLTRIVYCDGKTAGYLAIHYVLDYHHFTDLERATLEEFTRILSVSLSRYEAKKENRELKLIHKMQSQLEESLTFTNFFLDTYISAYYVNFEDLSCQVYKRTADLEDNYPIITNYFDSLTEYIENDVHPDDREILLEMADPDNMKEHLKNEPQFSHIFRDISDGTEKTYRMQVIRGAEENHAAFGFMDITAETVRRNESLREAEEAKKLIESIAATYNVAYAVNLTDDSFRLLRLDDDVIGNGMSFATFTEAKEFFVGLLPVSDRDQMRHELDYDTIREKLSERKSYNTEYRIPINGAIIWHEMNITLIDDEYVAIGFAKKDLEITQKHLEDKRYSEYFALYEIDIDTGMLKIVKDSPWYEIDRAGTAMPYEPAMLKFAQSLDGEAKDFFTQAADLEYVKTQLAEEDKHTYAYRSNNVGERDWVECTSYVTLRHSDGTPAMFTFGFSMIDSLGVFRQELQHKYKEALDIANEEKRRNDILHDIIHSGKWSFFVNENDEIVQAEYSQEALRIINNDFTTGARDWTDILHPEDADETLKAFNATIADHTCSTPYDVTYRMADRFGEYHWFHSAGRMIRNEDGTGEFFGIHIDITSQIEEQLEQHRQLASAREAADAANRSKTNFLFNMSHDIRTPMNAIRGFTTMAKKNLDNREKMTEYLEKIDISGRQLLALINQVLEMARIEAGKIEFDEKPVNVREEFNSMVTVLSEQANANGLKFSYSLRNVEHNYLLADVARMGSITLNIAGNAMKYTPEGGNIDFCLEEISSRKPGFATYVLSVADTGIGMSEEYLKELYEPFSREKSTTVSRIQGTGLGLAIVKSIIDLMGGRIEVRSELGKGTRFDITVDFKINEEAVPQEKEEDNIRVVNLAGRRVLLVEDNEMNREIAKDILEEHGLIVEEAEDGDIAVEMVRNADYENGYSYYDFILMDIQMPRMNGYEATKAIRALPHEDLHIPIIAITANAFEEDRQNALAAGMDEHVAKPINVKELIGVLAKFL